MIMELKHIYKDYLQGKIVVPVLKDINILNINVFDTRKYGRVSLIFLNRKG